MNIKEYKEIKHIGMLLLSYKEKLILLYSCDASKEMIRWMEEIYCDYDTAEWKKWWDFWCYHLLCNTVKVMSKMLEQSYDKIVIYLRQEILYTCHDRWRDLSYDDRIYRQWNKIL